MATERKQSFPHWSELFPENLTFQTHRVALGGEGEQGVRGHWDVGTLWRRSWMPSAGSQVGVEEPGTLQTL